MTIKFKEKDFIIGGAEWTTPFRFTDIIKLGSSGEPTWQDIVLSGNGSLTLTHAKANGLNYVKLYGGTRQCSLPKGYKQVASLESDGTASLATPFIVANVAKVEGTVSFTNLTTGSGLQYVVGGRISSAASSTGVGYCLYAPAKGGLTFYPMAWRDTSIGTDVTIGTQYAFSSKIVTGDQKLIVNNIEKAALTYTITKSSGTNTIALFALGTAGSQYTGDGVVLHDKILFYNDNDELLAYYIFVERESDNALGALNLLDGSFITNSSGTFTKGAYVTDTAYPVQVVPTPTNSVDITCNNGKIGLAEDILNPSAITWSTSSVIVYSPLQVGDGTFTLSTPDYLDDSTYTNMFFLAGNVSTGASSTNNGVYKGKTVTQTAVNGYVTIATRAITSGRNMGDPHDYTWYLRKTNEYSVTGTVETIKDSIGNNTNLLEATTTLGGTLRSATPVGGNGTTNNKRCRIEYQYLPAGTYTLSNNGETVNQALGCTYSDNQGSDGAILEDTAFNWKSLPYTFTLTENCYVRFMSRSSEDTTLSASNVGEFLITQNDNTATAETLFSVTEEYTDTQEVLTGTVTRKCKVVIFDGSENWSAANNACYMSIGISGISFEGLTAYCTHFTYDNTKHSTSTIADNTFIFNQSVGQTGTNGTVTIKATSLFTTAPQVKAWLANQYANGTPVIMVVPIPTEVTETVAAQSLNIQEGSNTFTITQASLDGLGIEASYKGHN